VGYHNTIV